MEDMEKPVWLKEPETPLAEEGTNPECGLDICQTKCCGCDTKFL
jgi:hypothetical protein